MRCATRLVLAAITTLLAGCDTIDGIQAEKFVQKDAEDACILQALKDTPGVSNVRQQTSLVTGWVIAGEGPQHGSRVRTFIYDTGTGYPPAFMIEDFGNGRYRYSHTMLVMNRMVPHAVIDQTLPVMRDAERRMARECGVEIDTGMTHFCSGSPCKVS